MAIEQQRLARPNPTPNPFGVQSAGGMPAPNPVQLFLGNLLGGGGGGVNIANLIQQLRGMGIPGLPDIGQGWWAPGSSPNGGITGMPGMTPSLATPLTGDILPQTTPSMVNGNPGWFNPNPNMVPSPDQPQTTGGPTPSSWTSLPMMGLSGGSGMVLG